MSNKKNRKSLSKKPDLRNNILILAGIAVLVVGVILIKNLYSKSSVPEAQSQESQSLEVQFDQYLEEGKPTFAFFHSNNCQLCLDMIGVVEQTYPTYKENIALVDINVYDPANENLLQREGINSIPTQVFVDSTGQKKVIVGVMTPDQLRQELDILANSSR